MISLAPLSLIGPPLTQIKNAVKPAIRLSLLFHWPMDVINSIISAVAEQVFTDEMINHLADKVMAIKPDKPTSKLIFENQLSEVNLQIENLVNAVQMGIVSDTTKAHLAELEQRRSELEKRIKECSEDGFMPARDDVVEYIRRLREYSNMNDELKRVLVDVFVEEVMAEGEDVKICMKKWVDHK